MRTSCRAGDHVKKAQALIDGLVLLVEARIRQRDMQSRTKMMDVDSPQHARLVKLYAESKQLEVQVMSKLMKMLGDEEDE